MALASQRLARPEVQAIISRLGFIMAQPPLPIPISDAESFFVAHKTSIRTNHMITTARKLAMPKTHPAKVKSRMSP